MPSCLRECLVACGLLSPTSLSSTGYVLPGCTLLIVDELVYAPASPLLQNAAGEALCSAHASASASVFSSLSALLHPACRASPFLRSLRRVALSVAGGGSVAARRGEIAAADSSPSPAVASAPPPPGAYALPPLASLAAHASRTTPLRLAGCGPWPVRTSSLRARTAGQWLAAASLEQPRPGRIDPYCVTLWPDCPEGLLLLDISEAAAAECDEAEGRTPPCGGAPPPILRPRPLLITSDEAVLSELAAAAAALPARDGPARDAAEAAVHALGAALRPTTGLEQLAAGAAAALKCGWLACAEAVLARAASRAAAADDVTTFAEQRGDALRQLAPAARLRSPGGHSLLAAAAASGRADAVALVSRLGGAARLFGSPWGDEAPHHAGAASRGAPPPPASPLLLAAWLALRTRDSGGAAAPCAAAAVAAQLLAMGAPAAWAGAEDADGHTKEPAGAAADAASVGWMHPKSVMCWAGHTAGSVNPPLQPRASAPTAPAHALCSPHDAAHSSYDVHLRALDDRVMAAYSAGLAAAAAASAAASAAAACVGAAASPPRTLAAFGPEHLALLAATIFLPPSGMELPPVAAAVAAEILAADGAAAAAASAAADAAAGRGGCDAWAAARATSQAPRAAAYAALLLLMSLLSLKRALNEAPPLRTLFPPLPSAASTASAPPPTALSHALAVRLYAGSAALWTITSACSALILVLALSAAVAPTSPARHTARPLFIAHNTRVCALVWTVINLIGPILMEAHARQRFPQPVTVPHTFLARHIMGTVVSASLPMASLPKAVLLCARCLLVALSALAPRRVPLWPTLATICGGRLVAGGAVVASHVAAAVIALIAERRAACSWADIPTGGLAGDVRAASAALRAAFTAVVDAASSVVRATRGWVSGAAARAAARWAVVAAWLGHDGICGRARDERRAALARFRARRDDASATSLAMHCFLRSASASLHLLLSINRILTRRFFESQWRSPACSSSAARRPGRGRARRWTRWLCPSRWPPSPPHPR